MDVINTGGPPSNPNFRGFGGPRRRKSGFWANFASQSFGFKLNVIGSLLGILLIFGYGAWLIWPRQSKAQEPQKPAVTESAQTIKNDLPTLTPTVMEPGPVTVAPLAGESQSTPDFGATATFETIINRPAIAPGGASPYFIGVITYESGCRASNLGFTTSGYNGEPYYIYLKSPLDRDPLYQVVQITGIVQRLEDCQHPVIFVDQLFWMDQQGTPSPLASPISTSTLTSTLTITSTPNQWGSASLMKTPTVYMPVQHNIPSLQTPLATYTPFPTYTPAPTQVIIQKAPKQPTYTPQPTYTRFPTLTPNPATATPTHTPTPLPANINGRVISVVGCPSSNLAIETGPGEHFFIILNGATLPAVGQPTDYYALAVGVLDTICNGQAIRANSINWYKPDPTATPTLTPTLTPSPTFTPTLTPTMTATLTPTVAPTISPTVVITSTGAITP